MEHFLLTAEEHKLLTKHKKFLEGEYNVQIFVPEVANSNSKDVIFATVCGQEANIENVKNSLQTFMMQDDDSILILEDRVDVSDTPVITLSDDDEEQSIPVLTDAQNRMKRKLTCKKKKKKKPKVLHDIDLVSPIVTDKKVHKLSSGALKTDTEKSVVKGVAPADSFIPLNAKCVLKNSDKISKIAKENTTCGDDDVVVIEVPEIERPIPKSPKCLRPIVIDGSNVAREHGKVQNTFSCKGIRLSVEYFLKRGHTQVTAFVPNFRRHHHFGHVPTTDHPILEELAKSQHVVFTPSRRVQGKRVTCYDDRFIVELASTNGGVILSNDNYKDLIGVSETFKKTIEERLLMFCFVGDLLMIPNDPLGRDGPTLDAFLSFPESETK